MCTVFGYPNPWEWPMCSESLIVCISAKMSTAMPQHVKPPYMSEWQNNLCAIIGLKPPLPILNALLVKVHFACLKGIIG